VSSPRSSSHDTNRRGCLHTSTVAKVGAFFSRTAPINQARQARERESRICRRVQVAARIAELNGTVQLSIYPFLDLAQIIDAEYVRAVGGQGIIDRGVLAPTTRPLAPTLSFIAEAFSPPSMIPLRTAIPSHRPSTTLAMSSAR
jgi:hypothetical protein